MRRTAACRRGSARRAGLRAGRRDLRIRRPRRRPRARPAPPLPRSARAAARRVRGTGSGRPWAASPPPRRRRRTWGTGRRSRSWRWSPPTSISASSRWQLLRQSRSPHWNSRRPATRASSTRERSTAADAEAAAVPLAGAVPVGAVAAGERPRREQRDADGAHGAGVGRHDDLALEHGRERPRQRRVGRRLALEEHAVEQPPLAHHAAAVVAHHGVLQAGEDVVAAEAVAERLGRHVGDEDGAGLAEVRRRRRCRRRAARTRRCRPRRGRSPAPRGTSPCRRCTRGSCPRRPRGRSRR